MIVSPDWSFALHLRNGSAAKAGPWSGILRGRQVRATRGGTKKPPGIAAGGLISVGPEPYQKMP
jgi:hypothetical protein